ncbi:hypothetical protein D3C72_1237350 [compost metagenome]
MIGIGPVDDAVAVEQHAGDARVLAGQYIGSGQRFQRAQGDVAKIADRRRHEIERDVERARGNAGIVQAIAALPLPIRGVRRFVFFQLQLPDGDAGGPVLAFMSEPAWQGKGARRPARASSGDSARQTPCFSGAVSAILPVHILPVGRPGHSQLTLRREPRPPSNG